MPSWVHLDLGQVITSVLLAGIGYGVRQVYSLAAGFIGRVHQNETVLDSTSEMVDRHSVALLRAKLIETPVKRVHFGRRTTDREVIAFDEEIHL